ncbi:variant erythrocyte surface antigen-1 family protein [Babesia caballi]|uniref:Variant erythrocyte surface antigen-1 family protein n=1 Tax=Babesia caballi TaxID=5871 RepID=A0AAV4LPK6_BABCB|nr:variant erythrocyte surface antigen-1 family protein [Babesia caballi]
MTSGGKSLTQAPKDLKEAIDWVLRVSGGDGMWNDTDLLAKALSDHLQYSSYKYDAFVGGIFSDIGINAQKPGDGLISRLATGLKTFIGYQYTKEKTNYTISIGQNGILNPGEIKAKGQARTSTAYTSAYHGSWFTDVNSGSEENQNIKKKKAVQCFFTAIEIIFEGLTELFFNCENGWKNQNLSGSNLKEFMTTKGFSDTQLNTSITGNQIIIQAFKDLNEFQKAYNSAGQEPSLDTFRSQLEQNAWSNPSASPLSELYILATYAYVQSTSPATPSFAGYSGTAALAGGAYGFNLGGIGTFMSALLA